MRNNRLDRLNSSIKRVVLEVINTRLDNPDIPTSVSVTSVDTTPDLSISHVYVDCLGSDEERKKMLRAVQSAGGLIRGEVSRQIQIRIRYIYNFSSFFFTPFKVHLLFCLPSSYLSHIPYGQFLRLPVIPR